MSDGLMKALGEEWRKRLRYDLLALLHRADRYTCDVAREQVEAELVWLESQGLADLARHGDGTIRAATVLERGQELIEAQRPFPGILRPTAPRG
jgi:hypothetical protein